MKVRTLAIFAALAGLLVFVSVAFAQTPPGQPPSGPGGADYAHSSYLMTKRGSGDYQYWVFEPRSPQPASAPVVVFLHGWGLLGMDPGGYNQWIWHLVKKGNIVIYPRYQATIFTLPNKFTPNAIKATKDAIAWLKANPSHVQPQEDKWAYVGHSMGGIIIMNMANQWQSAGLPQADAIFAVEPHDEYMDPNWNNIGSATLLNCLVGSSDTNVGRDGCDIIWDRTPQIPLANRDYVWMYTDTYGNPDLLADHYAPACPDYAPEMLDALDWRGFWKIMDGLRDCSFYGTNCAYGLGDTFEHRTLGNWSDGRPVTEMSITDYKP